MSLTNGHNDGLERGKNDAASGKDRNACPTIGEALRQGILHPRSYTDTFVEGYGKGYDMEKLNQALNKK